MEIKVKETLKFSQRLINAAIKPLVFLFLIQLNVWMFVKPAITFILE